MEPEQLENLEYDLLLEAVFRRYGYDYRNYARASLERRIRNFLSAEGINSPGEAIVRMLRDEQFFVKFSRSIPVPVTELFRDPEMIRVFREQVIPGLTTLPSIKIWHAGVASGEELWTLAILLKESGLLDRTILYGTDINEQCLDIAREGIYPLDSFKKGAENYYRSGGKEEFSRYYLASYGCGIIAGDLRKRAVFSAHNLATDSSFGEMQVIFCRNVLIYFNHTLQDRALQLFQESLSRRGILCLGMKETIKYTAIENQFDVLDERMRIHVRRN